MKNSLILLFALLLLTAGCSKRAWYDGFQSGHRHECGKLEGEAKEKCLQKGNMSYDRYEEYRK